MGNVLRMAKSMLYTIGVYGSTAAAFFGALEDAGVDVVLDIRLRRAVRGAQYTFANAQRLMGELADRGIAYKHVLDLAPDLETLHIQGAEDEASGKRKSERTELAPGYTSAFTSLVLKQFPFDAFAKEMLAYRAPCLLCIERVPSACHRSLVAPPLAAAMGAEVGHLLPSGTGFDALATLRKKNRSRAAARKKYG
ncbi:MAG: hypothetical protein NVSMB31_00500 [Vulcanimicrobiaceae bacterium]